MNPLMSINIMSFIQVYYPGGLIAFKEEHNGNIFMFPREDSIIICADNLPEEFSNKISAMCKKFKIKLMLSTEQNFQHETEDEINEWAFNFSQFLRQINMVDVLVGVTPCTIYIDAREYQSDSKDALIDYLNKYDEIVRVNILFKDKNIFLSKNRKPKEIKEIQPEVTHPLTDDDITNIKITLNTIETVEDFLKIF